MCGIFGVITTQNGLSTGKVKKITQDLLKISESRGKESSGVTAVSKDKIKVYKSAKPAHVLTSSKEFDKLFSNDITAVIGHARLVTNGGLEDNRNNQPVIKDKIVGVHNGIITNVDELFCKHQDLKRKSEVDTEIILSLVGKYYQPSQNLSQSIKKTFDEIEGAASIALVFEDINALAIATNTGSLYLMAKRGSVIFASERSFLEKVTKSIGGFRLQDIKQVFPGSGFIIDLKNLKKYSFSLLKENPKSNISQVTHQIEDFSYYPEFRPPKFEIRATDKIKQDFEKFNQKIQSLRRCTRCILPETIPFIEFDDKGVCNYCHHWQEKRPKGEASLEKLLEPHRRIQQADCLVTFSGGRDSSYGLHYLKKVMKMNPIAYTYDWGMITDLGRRNQSRMTGKLGIEQILQSADIKKKRDNIRKNVLAWLKKPDLGTIPIFMAGDKQYFTYLLKIKKHLGIQLIIICTNPFEKTDFKYGFCNIKPDPKILYRLSGYDKIKMAFYYLNAYLKNPSYLNSSLTDTIFAYFSYYFVTHDLVSLYEYVDWDEKTIEKTLIGDYNWEIAPDTQTTWRIGDGTASFYNYIYYTLAGFSENDTFRSNQIRQGVFSRQEALQKSEIENQPRWESIQWYCDTIGIDSRKALEIINATSKRYE